MSRQERLRSLEKELEAEGHSKHDVVYRTTLATLVRQKQKVRVMPRDGNEFVDYDKMVEGLRMTSHGTRMDPEHPPPPPYKCALNCETCFTQTFPGRIQVTDAVAHEKITALTTEINNNLDHLRTVLHDHADYIVTKWRKSKAKRSSALSAVCAQAKSNKSLDECINGTGLYDKKWAAVHLIDERSQSLEDKIDPREVLKGTDREDDPMTLALAPFLLRSLEKIAHARGTGTYQTTWLLPYLDAESLVEEPLLFLSLLHARTAHSSEEWMLFDNFQLKLSEHWEIIVAEFNPHFVVMTGAEYGLKLVDWEMDRCHHWQIVGYNKAVYILTAQHHMMRFLRETVNHLLGDRSSDRRADQHSKWEQLARNGFSSFGSSSSLRIRASANQPFSAPPVFDPVQTTELIASMYQACVDELDLAQTSPAFVQCLVRIFRSSLYSATMGKEDCWGVIVDEIMCTTYRRFISWRQMNKESEIMLEHYRQYIQKPTDRHRRLYETSVFCLHNIAIEHFAQQNLLVQYSLPFERGFERNFEYERKVDGNKKTRMYIDDEDAFHCDKLFWSIRALGFDQSREFTLDPSFNFRVLDDILSRSDGKERKRISEQLLRSLSEMAVVEEIRVSIECDRTWSREPDMKILLPMPKFRTEFIKKYAQQMSLPKVIEAGGLSGHLRSFHKETPWPSGTINASWVAAAAASHKSLNDFWRHFRASLKAHQTKARFPTEFIEEDQEALSAADRPSNARAVQEEEAALQEAIRAKASRKSSQQRPVPSVVEWPLEEREKFVAPPVKEKKKTRSVQSTETSSEDAAPSPATRMMSDVELTSIDVKAETYNLFRAMFAAPKAHMRSYSWMHFTQAMVDAGCSITQGSGSAVHFRSFCGVIVFHRPHPEPNIPQEIFIAIGKRLTKRFGWLAETFRCDGASRRQRWRSGEAFRGMLSQ